MNEQELNLHSPEKVKEARKKALEISESIEKFIEKKLSVKIIAAIAASNLIKHLESIGFFIAPASSYHNNSYLCGLAEHSYDVMRTIEGMTSVGMIQARLYNGKLSDEYNNVSWLMLAGLLHDVGKAAVNQGKSYYKANILKTGQSEAKPYTVNDQLLGIPDSVMSYHFAVTLFPEMPLPIQQAILYHNGRYGSNGSDIIQKETPEMITLHYADMLNSLEVK